MRRIVFLWVFTNICFAVFSQAKPLYVCQPGFTFEISMQKSWGYSQPVVLSVVPNSSADAGGLKVGDIIEKINEIPTRGEMIETIIDWVQNAPEEKIKLTVSNLNGTGQELTLSRHCHLNNSITERELADVYSFYSLENAQTRTFTCPFKTIVNPEARLIRYTSFGFSYSDPNNFQLEKTINVAIQKSLEQKGLKYSEKNPDLIVQTYYSHAKNPNFRKSTNPNKFPVACRYNVNTKSMENLPIYYNPLIHKDQAQFFLEFGIRLIDPTNNQQAVWECEANELLQSDYSLGDYAEIHVPLMFMQYPYPMSTETASFYYGHFTHNYTGIRYNMYNLKEIAEVDPSSPAAKVGIQPGDLIEKINGIKFNTNLKSADNHYKQFIYKTMPLRDHHTQFTNAEGFSRCMYWDKMKYAQVADEFRKTEFSTVFSYLFYFEPYVNLSGTNVINLTVVRGKEKMEIKLKPLILSEEIFRPFIRE